MSEDFAPRIGYSVSSLCWKLGRIVPQIRWECTSYRRVLCSGRDHRNRTDFCEVRPRCFCNGRVGRACWPLRSMIPIRLALLILLLVWLWYHLPVKRVQFNVISLFYDESYVEAQTRVQSGIDSDSSSIQAA